MVYIKKIGKEVDKEKPVYETIANLEEKLNELEQEMREAAEILNFERAADLRDRINELRGKLEKGQHERQGFTYF